MHLKNLFYGGNSLGGLSFDSRSTRSTISELSHTSLCLSLISHNDTTLIQQTVAFKLTCSKSSFGAPRLLQDTDDRFAKHALSPPLCWSPLCTYFVCAGGSWTLHAPSLWKPICTFSLTPRSVFFHSQFVPSNQCSDVNVFLGTLPESRLRSTPIKYLITLNIDDNTPFCCL